MLEKLEALDLSFSHTAARRRFNKIQPVHGIWLNNLARHYNDLAGKELPRFVSLSPLMISLVNENNTTETHLIPHPSTGIC